MASRPDGHRRRQVPDPDHREGDRRQVPHPLPAARPARRRSRSTWSATSTPSTPSSTTTARSSGSRPTRTPRAARSIAIDTRKPEPAALGRADPAGGRDARAASTSVGDHFLAAYLKDAHTRGPGLRPRRAGTSATSSSPAWARPPGFDGKRTDKETFYAFTSFTTPVDDLSLRRGHGREHGLAAAQAQLRPGRLRDDAGLLPEQGRDARSRCSSATRRG